MFACVHVHSMGEEKEIMKGEGRKREGRRGRENENVALGADGIVKLNSDRSEGPSQVDPSGASGPIGGPRS